MSIRVRMVEPALPQMALVVVHARLALLAHIVIHWHLAAQVHA